MMNWKFLMKMFTMGSRRLRLRHECLVVLRILPGKKEATRVISQVTSISTSIRISKRTSTLKALGPKALRRKYVGQIKIAGRKKPYEYFVFKNQTTKRTFSHYRIHLEYIRAESSV